MLKKKVVKVLTDIEFFSSINSHFNHATLRHLFINLIFLLFKREKALHRITLLVFCHVFNAFVVIIDQLFLSVFDLFK